MTEVKWGSGSKDPEFQKPFIDVDEWRDEPVRHRYVHGGFEDTELRFSYYFPPVEQYGGRFFQPISAVSGNETMLAGGMMAAFGSSIGFGFDSGAYMVESNLGLPVPWPAEDTTLAGYRASAAAAEYSRVVAAEMYGEHRPYGYCYGGSGGGFKTISCLESTRGVWDGGVPFVHPANQIAVPVPFGTIGHISRLLRHKLPMVIDNIDPGSGVSMYDGLNAEERDALAEATRLGCPPRTWFAWQRSGAGAWTVLADMMIQYDPEYFEDFWTVPGYLGYDAPRSLDEARVQHKTNVVKPILITDTDEIEKLGLPPYFGLFRAGAPDDLPIAIRVADVPDSEHLVGGMLKVTSGKCAGHNFWISNVIGDVVLTTVGQEHYTSLSGVEAGDEVMFDNSHYLAVQTYARHMVEPGIPEWDQYVVNGEPIYPQRPELIGARYARNGAGSVQSGRFDSKMIVVQTLMDEFAWPCVAVHYRKKVQAVLGDRIDDQYRLWFIDHAMHGGPYPMPGEQPPMINTRIVSYQPVLEQALRDVAAWAEYGVVPPANTTFEHVDGQVLVPAKASERHGIQPTVDVTANGGERAEVAAGEEVHFSADIEVPPGTGTIVGAEWDFDGAGLYPLTQLDIHGASAQLTIKATHTFTEPGTYFPALRVYSQRDGKMHTPYARVQNLGRVRVVVS